MKKALILCLSFLILANVVIAAAKSPKLNTTVGIIQSINPTDTTFVIKKTGIIKFIADIFHLFRVQKTATLTIITTTETEFKKKTTEGVASGTFTDLVVRQKVQVKGSYLKESTTGKTSLKATNVFILTPVQVAMKECQTDTDCAWCGNTCVDKDTLKNKMCAQVMPPEGYDCQCVLDHDCPGVIPTTITSPDGHVTTLPSCGYCKKILRSGPSTTHPATSTSEIIDKTCLKACQDKQYHSGICRSWPITATAHYGCNPKETDIGWSTDCNVPQGLLGVGKTCCCKNQD